MFASKEHIDQLLKMGVVQFGVRPERDHWQALVKEARAVPFWLKRSVAEWVGVQRATYFVQGQGMAERRLEAWRHVPGASNELRELESSLQLHATERHLPQLATHFNRVGFNYMNGTAGVPARIPSHQDPEALQGIVAVANLEGFDTGSLTPTPGSVALIACRDLCEAVGIEPVTHDVMTYENRMSLTLAHLTA